jgi:hypothetical protein
VALELGKKVGAKVVDKVKNDGADSKMILQKETAIKTQ